MLLDSFLTFRDGPVEVAFTYLAAALVAYCVERDDFGIVVLVVLFFIQRTFDVGQCTIVIGVVARSERVPPTALGGVLLRGTSDEHAGAEQEKNEI
mgnify:FL=1